MKIITTLLKKVDVCPDRGNLIKIVPFGVENL